VAIGQDAARLTLSSDASSSPFVLIFAQPLTPAREAGARSCEAGVPVQRGRKGDELVTCKPDHRAPEAGGFFM
jgi:hypothetical protein